MNSKVTVYLITLTLGAPALADSVLHVGDVFSDGAKLVKIERLPETPDGPVFGSNGREYRDDDVRAHVQPLRRTRSSKFILLYSGGDASDRDRARASATHLHVRRILAELRSSDGVLVGFEVAEERGTSILKSADLETGRIAKLHPQVIEGAELAGAVNRAAPEIEVDTNWGAVESCLKWELSNGRDREYIADFIEAAKARQNYAHTALGKYYAESLRGLARTAPVGSIRLTRALESQPIALRTESTIAIEAVRAVESAR